MRDYNIIPGAKTPLSLDTTEATIESAIDKELDERIKRIQASINSIRALIEDLKMDNTEVVEEKNEQPR